MADIKIVDATDLRTALESLVKEKLSRFWNRELVLEAQVETLQGEVNNLTRKLQKERDRSDDLRDELAHVCSTLKKARSAMRARRKPHAAVKPRIRRR